MSYFDIDPVESAQQINTATLNSVPPDNSARWYQGIGTGILQGVQSAYYRDIFNVSKATKDQAGADRAIEQVDALKPDPNTVGFVGQLMHGFGDTLGTVLLNVAGGNVTPQTAAMSSAQSFANSQTAIHIREGVDPLTAEKIGRLEGIGVGLGVVAPAALPGSLLMRATSGAGINAVLGGGQRALISNTLTNAGYGEMAKQYSPFDGASVATDLAIGGFFGGLLGERGTKSVSKTKTSTSTQTSTNPGAQPFTAGEFSTAVENRLFELQVKRDGLQDVTVTGDDGQPMVIPGRPAEFLTDGEKAELAFLEKNKDNHETLTGYYNVKIVDQLMPSDLDTVLTNNNAAHVEIGTAPGIPTDPAARRVHVDTLNQAIEDLMAGREVSVKDDVTQANFIEDPSAVQTRTEIAQAVTQHLDDLEGFKQELGSRGLPTDPTLYSISNRIRSEPLYVGSELDRLKERAIKENWSTEQLINGIDALKERVDVRTANNADKRSGDRVRGYLRATEVLSKAERLGDLSPQEVALGKWLLDKNPNIANDLAISVKSGEGPVGGEYNPLKRLATIIKGNGDPLTTVHEFLHHGERMMPQDVRMEIQNAWLNEVKRVQRSAEAGGDLNLQLFINDVIKANLGIAGADERLRNMVADGHVSGDAYQLVNPSEFWAVNASKLVRERANEGWVQKAVQWVKELVAKMQDIFGIKSDAAVIRGLDALLKSDGQLTGDVLAANAPRLNNVEAPGKNVGTENLNGFEPDLRVKVPIGKMKLPEKPLVLTGTNKKNAARQIANIDEILAKFPDADKSPLEWSKMMAYAMATDDVPVPPYRFLKDINSDGAFKSLSRLSPGQIADAQHGFENAAAFRDAYINKKLDVETTGKLFLWSFLSRGVSPYTQEGLFIDGFKGAGEWIKKAADGNLTEADFPAYEAWAKSVAPQGSGQPGSGATHNLNAFGRLFLFKMGQRDANGLSLLQTMHNMMEDPNVTGQQLRRWFIENTEGVGIDNKVVSFTLLVAGFKDLMVLDRVQIRQLWDDGRFGDRNLYDGRKVEGKPVAGSALSEITYGARGLLIYEAIERALAKRIENLYTALGRPEDGSVGRYHWETWVADSQQEASHGTLDAILHDAQGNPDKIAQVTAKEGEYGAYAYGARYGRDANGTPYFMYGVNGMPEYRFTVPAFRDFLAAVKLPANEVVPTKFKVTEAGNAPWYEKAQVNKQALDALAKRYAGESSQGTGAGTVPENGQGQAISNSAGRAASDPYSPEALIAQSPALTIIREDGTMVSAGRALTDADAEIASAQRDSQGYDAAVACALRG
jgi:hypothetical protein